MSWVFEYHAHGGRRYLYAVEKRRTPKGPRNTRYVYLGTAESLLKRLATPGKPLKSFEFGKLGAMVHAAQETGLLEALGTKLVVIVTTSGIGPGGLRRCRGRWRPSPRA